MDATIITSETPIFLLHDYIYGDEGRIFATIFGNDQNLYEYYLTKWIEEFKTKIVVDDLYTYQDTPHIYVENITELYIDYFSVDGYGATVCGFQSNSPTNRNYVDLVCYNVNIFAHKRSSF